MPYEVKIDATQVVDDDHFDIDTAVALEEVDIEFTSLSETEDKTLQADSKSIILLTDQALNVNYFGGAPQTNVTLLLMVAE